MASCICNRSESEQSQDEEAEDMVNIDGGEERDEPNIKALE